jgi:Xaa-Pro dipeptidase
MVVHDEYARQQSDGSWLDNFFLKINSCGFVSIFRREGHSYNCSLVISIKIRKLAQNVIISGDSDARSYGGEMSSPERLEKLHRIMEAAKLDAVALVPGSNLCYLTGAIHHLMERPLILIVPQHGEPVAVMPNLEAETFSVHGFQAKLFQWRDEEGYDGAIQAALKEANLKGKTLGVEGQRMRFFEGEALRRHEPAMTVVSADKAIAELRLTKDETEIGYMRRAVQISEAALRRTLDEIKIGMTEVQIKNILNAYLLEGGAQGLAFDSHVLAGENSARPHGVPRDDYTIQAGDPLLFDFGAAYRGYNADITRTFFVREANDHFRQIYQAVKQANEIGRALSKPGVTVDYVDSHVLQSLTDSGFEHLIVHKTGHGLGMDVHEEPYIMRGSQQVLREGMVFTVEPGLYESGAVGVRIEDNVVVRPDGAESLTTFTRELTIVG